MYPYESLNPERRNIRLVNLLPVKLDEMIRCRVETVSLDDLPVYTTLSYVWGDPADTRPILLDGHSHYATVNLECALRNLGRKLSEPQKFWIDALCVDQQNVSERSQQVNLMNAIYKQSSKAVVWLGEWDHDTLSSNAIQETYKLLEDLASNKHYQHIPLLWDSDGTYDKSRSEVCSIIDYLGSKSYWNRAWIVQEFILPSRADILCGPFSVNRDLLAKAGGNHGDHLSTCCNTSLPSLRDLGDLHTVLAAFTVKFLLLLPSRLGTLGVMDKPTLWNLLCTFRRTEASDHRDKIFAFLGLPEVLPAPQQLLPDYTMTTQDLYTTVACRMVSESRSLFVLTQCTRKECYPQLPSWIPDWTATETNDSLFMKWYEIVEHFFSAPGQMPIYDLVSDSKILITFGIKISTVKVALDPDPTSILCTLVLWYMVLLVSRLEYQSAAECILASRGWRKKLMRTAIGDLIFSLPEQQLKEGVSFASYRRVRDEDLNVLDSFMTRATSGVDAETIIQHPDLLYRELLNSLLAKRAKREKLLILDQNLIGLGPQTAQEGDEIWIMPSSPVPIVLRPFKTNASDGGEPSGLHQLVGHCYVDGVMDGEATENYEEKLETVRIA